MRTKREGRSVKKPWFKKPSKETSMRMTRVKSRNTKLEKAMESLLRRFKIKYERQPELEGTPDFRIKGTNIVVFCDSSFWHGRREKEVTGEAFKKNREFWQIKLLRNVERDKIINRVLRREGWQVLRFWDSDILKRPEKITKRLLAELGKDA